MNMIKTFYPDRWVTSAFSIDYQAMYENGYRGVIFDIDNTLTMHGSPATAQCRQLFEQLRLLGMKTCLISNNKENRVKPFAHSVQSPYICNGKKPSRLNYLKGMKMMKTKREHTFFVGDQLFTDIWGAKRAGIYAILVDPIDKKEELQIVLKRYLERPVLKSYQRNLNRSDR